MQASYDNMVSIAGGFTGIIGKLRLVASQGGIMTVLPEVLDNRTKAPAIQLDGTPTQHL